MQREGLRIGTVRYASDPVRDGFCGIGQRGDLVFAALACRMCVLVCGVFGSERLVSRLAVIGLQGGTRAELDTRLRTTY